MERSAPTTRAPPSPAQALIILDLTGSEVPGVRAAIKYTRTRAHRAAKHQPLTSPNHSNRNACARAPPPNTEATINAFNRARRPAVFFQRRSSQRGQIVGAAHARAVGKSPRANDNRAA